jgi:3-deoxy-D-manno-octulosonic-acid transferase
LLDYVFYLPIDSKKNAHEFVDKFKPTKAFFIKYDFWFFYFKELQKRNIPLYVVSGLFRENQWFFSWYGKWFLKVLKNVTHFFVQDEKSKQILFKNDIKNVSVTGDTRFDNVTSDELKSNPLIDDFCKESEVIIMGSSWQKEEELMREIFSELPPNIKLIIVPHDVSKNHIQEIEQKFSSFNPIKFSEGKINDSRVLIVDTIGVLKYAYSQSSIAVVGGGFKNALHNILEPAVCGLPVLYGNNFSKYPEGKLLINAGGGFAFENASQLKHILADLLQDKKYKSVGKLSKQFVEDNKGATEKIVQVITN